MRNNAHSGGCLCNNASDNALEEEVVFFIEDVDARWEEEVKVEKPAIVVPAVTEHKVRYGDEVVEIKRSGEPRATCDRGSLSPSKSRWWVDLPDRPEIYDATWRSPPVPADLAD